MGVPLNLQHNMVQAYHGHLDCVQYPQMHLWHPFLNEHKEEGEERSE